METEDSLLNIKEPAICSCSEPDQSSLCPILLLEDPFKYYCPIYVWDFQTVFFSQVPPPNPCMSLSSSSSSSNSATCLAHPILIYLITRIIFGEGTDRDGESVVK